MTNARPLQPSRRGLMIAMAGGAAASGIAIPVLAAEPHPDAELIRLEMRLNEARPRLDEAVERAELAVDRFEPPMRSTTLIATDTDVLGGLPIPDMPHCVRGRTWWPHQIEELRTAPPRQGMARRTAEIIAAHDVYQAEFQAASDACGLTAADAEYVALNDEVERIGEAILATRATTLEGLAVKARTHIARYGAPPAEGLAELSNEGLALSIIADIAAMGAAA